MKALDCTGVLRDGTTYTFKVGEALVGLRFYSITLRLTYDRLSAPDTVEYIQHLRCRLEPLRATSPIVVEVWP